jgi:arsenate reductase-like glutaredoxin family protein
VLLRPAERKRLEKLAATAKVSAGEILRRSLRLYQEKPSDAEEELLKILLKEMNTALDASLESIRLARAEIRENLQKIEEMQAARP